MGEVYLIHSETPEVYLQHHGIKGQRWGVRRENTGYKSDRLSKREARRKKGNQVISTVVADHAARKEMSKSDRKDPAKVAAKREQIKKEINAEYISYKKDTLKTDIAKVNKVEKEGVAYANKYLEKAKSKFDKEQSTINSYRKVIAKDAKSDIAYINKTKTNPKKRDRALAKVDKNVKSLNKKLDVYDKKSKNKHNKAKEFSKDLKEISIIEGAADRKAIKAKYEKQVNLAK